MFATILATHKYWLSPLYGIEYEAAKEGEDNVRRDLWLEAANVSDTQLHSLG
jgi:hypothetical protein